MPVPLMARVDQGRIWEYKYISQSEIPPHKMQYWLMVEDISPDYDPATQMSMGPIETIYLNRVTREWTVRDKTPQELEIR